MASNLLVYTAAAGPSSYAAKLATAAGGDVGLVLTAIEFHQEKLSGGRVEEDREYGGARFQTFDEPVFIGSAIAQLAGHADAVVLDSLEDWTQRLQKRFPADPVALDAEIASLVSVMKAHMTELVLLARPAALAREAAAKALFDRVVAAIDKHCDRIVDLRTGAPRAMKGTLPPA